MAFMSSRSALVTTWATGTAKALGTTLMTTRATLRTSKARTALVATGASKSSRTTGATVMLLGRATLGASEAGAARTALVALGRRALLAVVAVLLFVVVVEKTHDR